MTIIAIALLSLFTKPIFTAITEPSLSDAPATSIPGYTVRALGFNSRSSNSLSTDQSPPDSYTPSLWPPTFNSSTCSPSLFQTPDCQILSTISGTPRGINAPTSIFAPIIHTPYNSTVCISTIITRPPSPPKYACAVYFRDIARSWEWSAGAVMTIAWPPSPGSGGKGNGGGLCFFPSTPPQSPLGMDWLTECVVIDQSIKKEFALGFFLLPRGLIGPANLGEKEIGKEVVGSVDLGSGVVVKAGGDNIVQSTDVD